MQAIQLQTESIVEIATFLVRRWSEKDNMIVEISDKVETKTRLNENKVIIAPLEKRIGDDFQKYRQFRTSLWYEAMRVKYCKKILSNDHAFGFILNTMETQRVEQLGRKIWKGMDNEIIFNYTYMLVSRPQLHTVYGKARIVEAFYQYFMFGAIKGEIQSSQFEQIKKASAFAKKIIDEAIKKNYDTEWLEKNVSEIMEVIDKPQPFISQHLRVLRQKEAVVTERDGNEVFYSLANPKIVKICELVAELINDRQL